jgi:hypothetical protein
MRALAEDGRRWFKSSRSSVAGHCVEVAVASSGVAVRDSKDADGPELMFGRSEFHTFVAGLKAGEFDI